MKPYGMRRQDITPRDKAGRMCPCCRQRRQIHSPSGRKRARRMTRLTLAALILLTGCATTTAPDWAGLGSQPYAIGGVRVFVMRAADVRTTCRGFSHAIKRTPPESPHGCYLVLGGVPTIVSVADPYVLLHEFKHFLSPEWRH